MRSPILADPERRYLAAALCASLAAAFVDNWAAPALHNHSPFWALGFLLALLCRPAREELALHAAPWKWSWTRAALFVALHAGIIALTLGVSGSLVAAAGESTVRSGAIASLKLLVLLPSLVLFPPSSWKRLALKYRVELVASAFVLFTWNPLRLFETVWPWYSRWLGRFVYAVSGMFVAGLGYVPGPAPTLTGPELDVSILFGCAGLNGVRLFQILFGVVLLVDWDHLKKVQVLTAYFAGLAAMILANALRIVSLVVVGNRVSASAVARFHVDAGWVFFTSAFLVFLLISYRWLLRASTTATSPAR